MSRSHFGAPGRVKWFILTRRSTHFWLCVVSSHYWSRWRTILCRFQIFPHKILWLVFMRYTSCDVFWKAILDATSLHAGDLVMRMWPTNLISPLHFFSLNYQLANFGLPIFGRREWHNEIGSVLTIWLQKASLGVHDKFCGRICRETGRELRKSLHMIGQFEWDRGSFVQGGLNRDYVVHFWL